MSPHKEPALHIWAWSQSKPEAVKTVLNKRYLHFAGGDQGGDSITVACGSSLPAYEEQSGGSQAGPGKQGACLPVVISHSTVGGDGEGGRHGLCDHDT